MVVDAKTRTMIRPVTKVNLVKVKRCHALKTSKRGYFNPRGGKDVAQKWLRELWCKCNLTSNTSAATPCAWIRSDSQHSVL